MKIWSNVIFSSTSINYSQNIYQKWNQLYQIISLYSISGPLKIASLISSGDELLKGILEFYRKWLIEKWRMTTRICINILVRNTILNALLCNKVWVKKTDTLKNGQLLKNPQFLSNPHETWWKWLPHEVIIFRKFHEDWTKIVDFFTNGQFLRVSGFILLRLYLKFAGFSKSEHHNTMPCWKVPTNFK